jgi:hypothetical protein
MSRTVASAVSMYGENVVVSAVDEEPPRSEPPRSEPPQRRTAATDASAAAVTPPINFARIHASLFPDQSQKAIRS